MLSPVYKMSRATLKARVLNKLNKQYSRVALYNVYDTHLQSAQVDTC